MSVAISDLAKMADQNTPGWYRNIDVDTLKMTTVGYCVVGQWKGITAGIDGFFNMSDYFSGIIELFGEDSEYRVNGVRIGRLLVTDNEAWKNEIFSRQETEAVLNDEDAMAAIRNAERMSIA